MARIIEQFHVDRPISEVFAAIGDFATAEQWDPGVESSIQVRGDRPGVGAAYELTLRMGAAKPRFVYETEVYEPDTHIVHATDRSFAWGRDDVRLEPEDDRTLVRWTADFALKGPGRLLDPLLQLGFDRAARKAVDGLQAWLRDGGQARPAA